MNKEELKQDSWRDDLLVEMKELARLGINVPKGAYKMAEQALLEDYQSMDNTEVVDYLIFMSQTIGERA